MTGMVYQSNREWYQTSIFLKILCRSWKFSIVTMCVSVCACVRRCTSSPLQQHKEDILLGAEVLHCGRPGANLTPQDVVEDLSHILLPLLATHRHSTTQHRPTSVIQDPWEPRPHRTCQMYSVKTKRDTNTAEIIHVLSNTINIVSVDTSLRQSNESS